MCRKGGANGHVRLGLRNGPDGRNSNRKYYLVQNQRALRESKNSIVDIAQIAHT